jgi:hypothetical protein
MSFRHQLIGVALLGFSALPVSLWAVPDCEAGTPNAMLQWASPKNWVLLSLGGPTDVTVTDSLTVYPLTSQLIGISETGNLTVSGASILRHDVLLNTAGNLNQSGPSYVRPVMQDQNADAYLALAKRDALWGAQCASGLTSTIDVQSVNITDPSGNMTIYAEQRMNVVNLSDLILTNGTLTLSSHFTKSDVAPTLIINISGTFRMEGGSKIVLDGTLDELHVLFNVNGTGQDVAFSGSTGSDGLPTTQISGVLLVPMRNINLSPGLVNGTVIGGGKSITITAGGQVISHLQ